MLFEREIQAARRAAKRAGERALQLHARGLAVEVKADGSPVTAADRESERMIAEALEQAFPYDGLQGEEGLSKQAASGRRWIIDPIDGTRDFVRGNPLWAILIGLEERGEVVAGVVRLPALGETYFAARGGGAYREDSRIRASSALVPSQSVLCISGLGALAEPPFPAGVSGWMARFWAVRCFGGILDAMLVASGRAEVWIEPKVAPWDLAAPGIILGEAGARFFDFKGLNSIYGGNCIGCAPGLEAEVRRALVGGNI